MPLPELRLPDYPPKTPPPPKRPVQPPRPEPDTKPKGTLATARRRMTVANRRAANWTLESAPWSVATARRRVLAQLHEWRHTGINQAAGGITTALMQTAVADGGRRVSVHLADQNGLLLILVLSHQADVTDNEDVLPRVAELGATSCGTDVAEDGRRLWAVLDL
ncbi:hypothetical protein ACIOEX_01365 [Streptomyces sp. NPDC087850]|uniref:hypothetical protein n=1 Tax=Streptomyces sp. NPDC087850 TaxID=3365809 RepID=UPI0037F6A58D